MNLIKDGRIEGKIPLFAGAHSLRRLFFGESLSLCSGWMLRVSVTWFAYETIPSIHALEWITIFAQFPILILALFAGELADRVSSLKLLATTHLLAALGALALMAMSSSRHTPVAGIFAIAAMLGVIQAAEITTRNTLVAQIANPKNVAARAIYFKAVKLLSSLMTLTRQVAPAMAGFMISRFGIPTTFGTEAAGYLVAVVLLMGLARVAWQGQHTSQPASHARMELGAGWGFVRWNRGVSAVLILTAVVMFAGMPASLLMPVFARDVFGGDAFTFAGLSAASGAGALLGSVLFTRLKLELVPSVIFSSTVVLGMGFIAFGLSPSPAYGLISLFSTGACSITAIAGCNTVLQALLPDDIRGKVSSYYTIAFLGTVPLGSLFAGEVTRWLSARAVVVFSGTLCLLIAAWFTFAVPWLRCRLEESEDVDRENGSRSVHTSKR